MKRSGGLPYPLKAIVLIVFWWHSPLVECSVVAAQRLFPACNHQLLLVVERPKVHHASSLSLGQCEFFRLAPPLPRLLQ